MQNIEDVKEVVVGKYYLVPHVCVSPHVEVLRAVPVIGPPHEDAEFIGFPDRHYHPDRRFVSDRWLDYYGTGPYGRSAHWGIVYSFQINGRDTEMFEIGLKRVKLRRVVETFRKDAPWLQKLEKAYASDRLRDGMICPHRGISCRGVKVNDQKCVVCPGHGLQFNVETGRLVSRIGQTFPGQLFKQ